MKEARFWEKVEGEANKVRCRLCYQECVIGAGKRGFCGVRENRDGQLFSLIYGSASSICSDPIEKKPLYHFHPGSSVMSLGTIGCNFRCAHCQNYTISQARRETGYLQDITAEQILKFANRDKCGGIAWTYNEPTIWHEFTYDVSKLAKEKGFYMVYVTNGYIQEEPLRELAPYLDAMNIDTKSLSPEHYKKVCAAELEHVLDTVKLAKALGIHIELTYLIIPGHNDDERELREYCEWVRDNVGRETPVHLSRFYPHYKMTNLAPTPMRTMLNAYSIGTQYLDYVYLGNVVHGNYENTHCPQCGKLVIERYGYSIEQHNLVDGKCDKCGHTITRGTR